jgi:hypothetical protein
MTDLPLVRSIHRRGYISSSTVKLFLLTHLTHSTITHTEQTNSHSHNARVSGRGDKTDMSSTAADDLTLNNDGGHREDPQGSQAMFAKLCTQEYRESIADSVSSHGTRCVALDLIVRCTVQRRHPAACGMPTR